MNQPDGSIVYVHVITPGREGCRLLDHEPGLRGRHGSDGADGFLRPVSRRAEAGAVRAFRVRWRRISRSRRRRTPRKIESHGRAVTGSRAVAFCCRSAEGTALRRTLHAKCVCRVGAVLVLIAATAVVAQQPASHASTRTTPSPTQAPQPHRPPWVSRRRLSPLPPRRRRQPRTFTAPVGLLFNTVRADRVEDFERAMGYLQAALAASTNRTRARAGEPGWRIFKATEPRPGGAVLYVFLLDPDRRRVRTTALAASSRTPTPIRRSCRRSGSSTRAQ